MIIKICQFIGLGALICFSFFYTNKAVDLVKDNDPIMIKLKENSKDYLIEAINASLIDNNYIIPGINGLEVNVNSSYQVMKSVNYFNENMLIYEETKPTISVDEYHNRYIVKGNKVKNSVSLIFEVRETKNLNEILDILEAKNVKVTFFLDGKWLEDNLGFLYEITNNHHEVSNYGYNGKYDKDYLVWTNNFIRELTYQNSSYCLLKEEDDSILDMCSKYRMKTIIPSIIAKDYHLYDIKKMLEPGSIMLFDTEDISLTYLRTVINFINSKGYEITLLSEHLSEKRK